MTSQGKLADDSLGITVSVVTPGFGATEVAAVMPEEALGRIEKQILVGWLCCPEDACVGRLTADASADITAQVWGVKRGMDR